MRRCLCVHTVAASRDAVSGRFNVVFAVIRIRDPVWFYGAVLWLFPVASCLLLVD